MRLILFILFSTSILADTCPFPHHEKSNKNKSKNIRSIIHPDDPTTSQVTEADFYLIINQTFALYSDQLSNDGRKIAIGIQEWETPYLSAWAFDSGEELTVNYWGGYARVNGTTLRSFALTACHEIGHLIGGEPTHTEGAFNPMMSAEGQADYFAASECFKKYIKRFPTRFDIELDPRLAGICEESFIDEEQKELCFETAQAGFDQSRIFAHLLRREIPDPLKPSSLIVEETLKDGYPTIQCRLDTYMAGAKSHFPGNAGQQSPRPKCWYRKSK